MRGSSRSSSGSGSRGEAPPRRTRRRVLATLLAGAAALAISITAGGPVEEAAAAGVPLTESEVRELVARSVHFASKVPGRPDLTVAVVDIEGNALGVFHADGVPEDAFERARRTARALAKAGTGAYFSSDEETFTTRTAAFIIQDHFPPGVRFAPAGPLYGVEFSSFATTDVNAIAHPVPTGAGFEARVRGDLGGVGLYKGGRRVGGLGLDDGDSDKQISIPDRILFGGECADDYRLTFRNLERGRQIERVAVAAARPYLGPKRIRATEVTVDGFRLPFAKAASLPETDAPPLGEGDGDFDPDYPLRGAAGIPSRFADFTLEPPPGAGPAARSFRGQAPIAFPIRAATDGGLTAEDVQRILWQGAQRASITRGAIRRPIGLMMQCWISVVDTNGEVLGVFRFVEDATLFSYDVSVQKARTAMFFSDDTTAWSCRAVGQFSQGFYPAGQQGKFTGPLHQLQDGITVGLLTGGIPGEEFPLRNGITIFPGGVPLYKGGRLVGAIGVSGDGIDQDDIVADYGSRGFGAPGPVRCDAQSGAELKRSLRRVLTRLEGLVPPDPRVCTIGDGGGNETAKPNGVGSVAEVGLTFFHARLRAAQRRVDDVPFVLEPSYVKHPRHPGPVTR